MAVVLTGQVVVVLGLLEGSSFTWLKGYPIVIGGGG